MRRHPKNPREIHCQTNWPKINRSTRNVLKTARESREIQRKSKQSNYHRKPCEIEDKTYAKLRKYSDLWNPWKTKTCQGKENHRKALQKRISRKVAKSQETLKIREKHRKCCLVGWAGGCSETWRSRNFWTLSMLRMISIAMTLAATDTGTDTDTDILMPLNKIQ